MRTLLQCRTDRLMMQKRCPNCGSHKTASFRADVAPAAPADLFSTEDKAAIRFYCGAEIGIDEMEDMIGRVPCALAMTRMVDDIELEADENFEQQPGRAA